VSRLLLTLGIGFFSGVLSGAFGIGGGVVTTPAIRLILGLPALIAVGTPLPVIVPSAVTGAWNYYRNNVIGLRIGVAIGVVGSVFAVAGALATQYVGGRVVLIATAAIILWTAGDMVLQAISPPRVALEAAEESDAARPVGEPSTRRPDESTIPWGWVAIIATVTGLYSGFLGLGGGFILVPLLTRFLHFSIKRAIGTSLLAISILAVPGTITHAWLGHVEWLLALVLTLGVIPGALVGSRITLGRSDRTVRIAFAVMLVIVGVWLGASELGLIGP